MTWHPWDALAQPSTLPDFKPVRLRELNTDTVTIQKAGWYKVGWTPQGLTVCCCATDPYNCPQGQALVQAIHDRKANQGDQ